MTVWYFLFFISFLYNLYYISFLYNLYYILFLYNLYYILFLYNLYYILFLYNLYYISFLYNLYYIYPFFIFKSSLYSQSLFKSWPNSTRYIFFSLSVNILKYDQNKVTSESGIFCTLRHLV
jgi:hypothetical protein